MTPNEGGTKMTTRKLLRKIIPQRSKSPRKESTEDDTPSSKEGNGLKDVVESSHNAVAEVDDDPLHVSPRTATAASQTDDPPIQTSLELEVMSDSTMEPEAARNESSVEAEASFSLGQEASRLWDEAYDILKQEDPELLIHYEKVMSNLVHDGPTTLRQRRPSVTEAFDNEIFQSDPSKRRKQMSDVVNTWFFNANANEAKLTEAARLVQEIIRTAAQEAEEAAVVWAATCLSAQCLLSPVVKSAANPSSFLYILSRMKWYSLLPRFLVSMNGERFSEEQRLLRSGIIDIYKSVLSYHVQVVDFQSGRVIPGKTNKPSKSDLSDLSEENIVRAEMALASVIETNREVRLRQLFESIDKGGGDVRSDRSTMVEDRTDMWTLSSVFRDADPQSTIPVSRKDNEKMLECIYSWAISTPAYCEFLNRKEESNDVLWVTGSPGSGKSMLMLAFVQQVSNQKSKECVSYFFCGNSTRSSESTTSVLRGLIFLLLKEQPPLRRYWTAKCNLTEREDFRDANDFFALSGVLLSMLQDENFVATLFVVDGFDELGVDNLDGLLSLVKATTRLSSKVTWLVSTDSKSSNLLTSMALEKQLRLHTLSLDSRHGDLVTAFEEYYVPAKIGKLAIGARYEGKFRTNLTEALRQRSAGNFLWVDIACEAIKRDHAWHALDIIGQLPDSGDIQRLYHHMKTKLDKLDESDREYCNKILLSMAVAYRPLGISELEELLELPPEVELTIIVEKMCFAFLKLRDGSVCFVHRSVRDFILNNNEGLGVSGMHLIMTQRCLRALMKSIRTTPKLKIDPKQIYEAQVSSPADYATLYWIKHLIETDDIGSAMDSVVEFLTEYHLEWSELLLSTSHSLRALVLLRELEGVLTEWLGREDTSGSINSLRLVRETYRFLRFHLSNASSADLGPKNTLLFCPMNSLTRQRFFRKELLRLAISPAMDSDWSPVMHELQGHSDYVRSCSYSSDGKLIASASDDEAVCIWDAATGEMQDRIEGFSHWVYAVCFSKSGLLAVTDRKTIKLCEVPTGIWQLVHYNESISDINDINFSMDGSMLAAAQDESIIIWDVTSTARNSWDQKMLWENARYNENYVRRVKFSENGVLLTSVSGNSVTIWNVEKRQQDRTMVIDSETDVFEATLSPNLAYLAAGTSENTVHIWNVKTGETAFILRGHTDDVNSVVFSPDGLRLASGSDDKTIRIWMSPWHSNGNLGQAKQVLRGHARPVSSVSFSPDGKCLVSSSYDSTLRIWDVSPVIRSLLPTAEPDTEANYQLVQAHERCISFLAFSDDGKFLASASEDGTICIWDGDTGEFLRKMSGHSGEVSSLVFSPRDRRKLASSSFDGELRLWNTENGTLLRCFLGHGDWVRCVVFSPDAWFLASASDDTTVRLWDIAHAGTIQDPEKDPIKQSDKSEDEEQGVKVLKGYSDYVLCVAISDDGQYLAAGGDISDSKVLLWKRQTGNTNTSNLPDFKEEYTIKDHSTGVISVTFQRGQSKVISSSERRIVVTDIQTGASQSFLAQISPRTLQTDERFPDHVITELGIVPLSNNCFPPSERSQPPALWPYRIFKDSDTPRCWITRNNEKLISLPELYRPGSGKVSTCVQGLKVVIGCESGQVLIFRFKE